MSECKYSFNPYYQAHPPWDTPEFSYLDDREALEFHRAMPGYRPTPLERLPGLARTLGVKEIYVKDEAHRYGVKAFKPLGASFAIYRFLKQRWQERFDTPFTVHSFRDPGAMKRLGRFTFCAATDGNHGRAVAWTARMLGQQAVIYMPANAARARIQNIRDEGAEVTVVPGTFDDCVRRCAEDAAANSWQAVSDTTYPGYMELPKYIMLGYRTMFHELEDSLHPPRTPGIDLVILPAGVGGLAAAGTSYYVKKYEERRPTLVCIEPEDSDCYLESIRFGCREPLPTRGRLESMMVGLACGIPSAVAWPIIRDGMNFFLAIPDSYAVSAMREYFKEGITSGESGCAGLAALLALVRDDRLPAAKRELGIDKNCRVLLINTEGDTDPENYRCIVGKS